MSQRQPITVLGRNMTKRTLCNRGCDVPLSGRDEQLHGGWRWRAPSATPALKSSGNATYVLVAQGLLYHVTTRHLGL